MQDKLLSVEKNLTSICYEDLEIMVPKGKKKIILRFFVLFTYVIKAEHRNFSV